MTTIDLRERKRLRAIDQLAAFEFLSDPTLQRIARLATALTGARSSGIHIVDDVHQHRLAAVGAQLELLPRGDALCEVVVDTDAAVVVADATLDERFAGSPFVTGDHPVRFFASAPLRSHDFGPLGTICVWDTAARHDLDGIGSHLADLADMVMDHFETVRRARIYSEQAMTDPLTGLPNRRLLMNALDRALSRHRREGVDVMAAIVDLDRFKVVNDAHGHQIGDEVLAVIGERLAAVSRGDEVCARLGGDEFAFVFVASPAEADAAMERVRETISRPIRTSVGLVEVGASTGTSLATDADDADRLLRRADAAMYANKQQLRL